MEIDDKDVETIKILIEDRGFEYSLRTNKEDLNTLAKKIGMKWNDNYNSWEKQ